MDFQLRGIDMAGLPRSARPKEHLFGIADPFAAVIDESRWVAVSEPWG